MPLDQAPRNNQQDITDYGIMELFELMNPYDEEIAKTIQVQVDAQIPFIDNERTCFNKWQFREQKRSRLRKELLKSYEPKAAQ